MALSQLSSASKVVAALTFGIMRSNSGSVMVFSTRPISRPAMPTRRGAIIAILWAGASPGAPRMSRASLRNSIPSDPSAQDLNSERDLP